MQTADLTHKMNLLTDMMLDVAADLDYYGGLNELMQSQAKQLMHSAAVLSEFVDELSP